MPGNSTGAPKLRIGSLSDSLALVVKPIVVTAAAMKNATATILGAFIGFGRLGLILRTTRLQREHVFFQEKISVAYRDYPRSSEAISPDGLLSGWIREQMKTR